MCDVLAQTHLDQLALLFPFLFQPANKNPTWSQSRGAGGWGRACLLVDGGARTRQQKAVTSNSSCPSCVVLWLWTGSQEKTGGPTARVDRSPPPRPGELNSVAVQWTGQVETRLFWTPIKITIWKRPCFCSVWRRGVFAVLDVSGSLLDRDPRGGRTPWMDGWMDKVAWVD